MWLIFYIFKRKNGNLRFTSCSMVMSLLKKTRLLPADKRFLFFS